MGLTTYSAKDIANWFISKANEGYQMKPDDTECQEYPEGISHLKLQKLLYFAQAAYLSLEGRKLFGDKIEAWDYGPVVPVVYRLFNQYGSKPIRKPKNSQYRQIIKKSDSEFLEEVWEIFGKFSANRLVYITHEHQPWQSAYKSRSKEITSKAMKDYYKGVFKRTD